MLGKLTPLFDWLMYDSQPRAQPREVVDRLLAEVRAGMDDLEHYLDHPPPPKRFNLGDVRLRVHWLVEPTRDDWVRAEKLWRRVFEMGGTGSSYMQEDVLSLIAYAADPATIPFWLEVLGVRRVRDKFAKRRRDFACSALGLIMSHGDKAGEEALWQCTQHELPEVRASALTALIAVLQNPEHQPSKKAIERLNGIATKNSAFADRALARIGLFAFEQPLPLDNPGGVYAIKTYFRGARQLYRTIEMRSEQMLDRLLSAWLHALHWDSDHLHTFYLSTEDRDMRFALDPEYGLPGAPDSHELKIGNLGLSLGDRFTCNYDFGDNHWFEMQVVAIHPADKVVQASYPRVIDSHGDAPDQYGRGDGDEGDF